jgi:hypothetical protein
MCCSRAVPVLSPTPCWPWLSPSSAIAKAVKAVTTADVESILGELPIAPEDAYAYNDESPDESWQDGKFHWIPVGRERGNAGRRTRRAVQRIAAHHGTGV